jgi:hypothetical protein
MNDQHLLGLLRKYKNKGVVIDTNLALLYIVGSLDRLQIRRHPRTSHFTVDDFERLGKFLKFFKKTVVTPYILAETSNLLGNDPELRGVLGGFVRSTSEVLLDSEKLVSHPAFLAVGLTDAGILEIARKKYLVVTDDGPLLGFAVGLKIDAVSLAQLRII